MQRVSLLTCFAGFLVAQTVWLTAAPAQEPKPPTAKQEPAKKNTTPAKAAEPVDPVAKEAARIAKWEPQIAAFDAADAKQSPAPGGIVFVGSSSIRMWNLGKSFSDLPAVNRGFGGSQLADTVHYFDRLVTRLKPKTVVVYAGDNDLAGGKTPEQVAADFTALCAKCKSALPEARLIFIGIKPSIARWKLIDKVRAANSQMQAIAQKHGVVFVDVDKPMLGENGQPKAELYLKDNLHMTEAGYEIWKGLLLPHLATK